MTKKQFAAKVFSKAELEFYSRSKKAVKKEIEIMKLLKGHKRVLELYEIHETRNSLYFVIEYLAGGELLKRIKSKRFYNENDAVKLMRNILEGLQYIHNKGIMHRDIKPSNILLTSEENDEDVKIVDYGLATECNSNQKENKKCGTPGFVAPELFKVKECINYNEKCDIFSTGVVFYIM